MGACGRVWVCVSVCGCVCGSVCVHTRPRVEEVARVTVRENTDSKVCAVSGYTHARALWLFLGF